MCSYCGNASRPNSCAISWSVWSDGSGLDLTNNRPRAEPLLAWPRHSHRTYIPEDYVGGPDTSITITAMRLRASSDSKPRSVCSISAADLGRSRFFGGLGMGVGRLSPNQNTQ